MLDISANVAPSPHHASPHGVLTQWFCVHTLPQHERTAEMDIQALGLCTLLIRFVTLIRRYNKPYRLVKPLFPCYLFVQLAPEDDWSAVHRLQGRNRFLLGPSAAPASLRDGEIDRVRQIAPTGIIEPAGDLSKPIPVGASVRSSGVMGVDWTGICQWSTTDRIGVLMQMLGGERVVPMPREYVAAV